MLSENRQFPQSYRVAAEMVVSRLVALCRGIVVCVPLSSIRHDYFNNTDGRRRVSTRRHDSFDLAYGASIGIP